MLEIIKKNQSIEYLGIVEIMFSLYYILIYIISYRKE